MSQADRRNFFKTVAVASAGASVCSVSAAKEPIPVKKVPKSFHFQLRECLGGDWPTPPALEPRLLKTEQKDGYRLEWVDYLAEPDDRVPAILMVPDGTTADSPRPGICIWHQHNGEWHFGKSEPAGLVGNPMHHTGVTLVKQGYVVLCPDALCFEERQDPEKKLKDGAYERFEFLKAVVDGKCMAWKNILDMRRAVDFIASRREVRADRLGCYGHSMGSTHAWLVGPWEPRLKCVVGNCCLPTYKGIHRTKLLHCFPNFIPGIYQYGDTPEIAALIAPRALHLNLGATDAGTPLAEAKEGIARIAAAFAAQNASENFSSFIQPDTGHVLSPEMLDRTLAVFAKHLNG